MNNSIYVYNCECNVFEQLLRDHFSRLTSSSSHFPIAFVHIVLPPGDVDVNLEPNKTRVLLHNEVSAHTQFLLLTILCRLVVVLFGHSFPFFLKLGFFKSFLSGH